MFGGFDGRVAEVLRVVGVRAASGDAGQRVQAEDAGGVLGAEPGRGGAVQSGEALPAVTVPLPVRNTVLRPASFSAEVPGRMRLVADQVGARDRGDEVVVEAFVPGLGGEVVRGGGEFVLALAGDAVFLGQPFGGFAQGDRPVRGHAPG